MTAAIVRGNALRIPLAAGSVHLVVTSPPYFALRSYSDCGHHYRGQIGSEANPQAFLEALWAVMDECWRVLADDGSAWINLGDKYSGGGHDVRGKSLMGLPWRFALGLTCPADRPGAPDAPQWILRAEVIWAKPNGLPESVTDRVRRSHENWFHLVKSPRYFAGIDEVREPHVGTTLPQGPRTMLSGNGVTHRVGGTDGTALNPLGKLPGSVWSVPSQPLKVPPELGIDHFAAFPAEWPRRIIAGWSPVGICEACGEGRRAVVVKGEQRVAGNPGRTYADAGLDLGAGRHGTNGSSLRRVRDASITGYVCACPEPTAPARPAVVLDPFGGTGTVAMMARAMGRYGVHIDLSRDYNRLARWRIFESGHGERCLEKHAAKTRPRKMPRKRRVKVLPVHQQFWS